MMSEIPKFVPREGQVDFTNVRWAPVVNTVVAYEDTILIVERNSKMNFYPGYWNGISGFLDDHRSIEEKVSEELEDELGLAKDSILSIELCGIFDQDAPDMGKTWIVHAILARVDTNVVTLNWEAQKYAWIALDQAKNYRLLPGFDQVLEAVVARL